MARHLVLALFIFQNFYFMSGHALAGQKVAENSHGGLSRPAFSDPAIKAPVSEDWVPSIKRDEEVPADADLVISLGKQMHPLVKDYIEQYASRNGLKIVLQGGSCGVTAKKLMKQQIDIGGYCCPPAYTDRLPGLEFHTIAIAPLVLITNPNNPVTNVSLSEARDIFQGATKNWSDVEDVGEKDNFAKRIQPIARLHCKIRPGHWRLLLENEDLFSPELASIGAIPDMISKVANSDKMIGYETAFMVQQYRDKGEVKILKMDGYDPADLDNVKNGKYPFYRTYNLTAWVNDKNYQASLKLIEGIKSYVNSQHKSLGFVSVSQLKEAGWNFKGSELVAEPERFVTLK